MISHDFYIQNPDSDSGYYLIDTILEHCINATNGGGAFAFMSSGGVNLLINDSRFLSFLEKSKFHLIVGVDAITDNKALDAINKIIASHDNLKINFFLPENKRSIFHPKFIWFQKENEVIQIIGSGNLTSGGLRWNVEAYSVISNDEDHQRTLREWQTFLEENKKFIYEYDNEKVIDSLAYNTQLKKTLLKLRKGKDELNYEERETLNSLLLEDEDLIPPYISSNELLVAEIPKNGDRLQQVNFDKTNFFDFFGASIDKEKNNSVYFFNISYDGLIQNKEVRPAVVVKSRNYRFELNAVKGLDYPKNGKPIGIYLKVAAKSFLYMVYLPSDSHHSQLLQLLDIKVGESLSKMRRVKLTAQEALRYIPDSPIWKTYDIN
ncbi:phospholipase D family protein [Pectobacterium brasiliense]|uniref:phospholipase D family protein n=1 Tax=Pectobacterium brasiliense TaxID=180957 RepID=UPI001CE12447|nr:phospholipase D family protein [Pectobacterium brasiliense]MCA5921780.1 phospholipase D family protein [Pectobacterium brasiliense]MCA5928983.1 phospholipase D family protein [Pectobacterium brasiliense]MCA5937840.1 phospholipase D family protein [Pectobacterium brasiliense]MCA5942024.1 phospholipase D family protein [Pectobacterium brasiliense]MCA5946136.1 phospholipase D family protein [Pectobacterium brasiliense]